MARDYSKISEGFWTRDTGKKIRAIGSDAQLVALYLISGPQSNMIGLYEIPVVMISHHTKIAPDRVDDILERFAELQFAFYDPDEERIWIPEMAKFQIGTGLSAASEKNKADNRIRMVEKEAEKQRKSRFFNDFVRRYGECYHLSFQATPGELFDATKPATRSPARAAAASPATPDITAIASAYPGGVGASKHAVITAAIERISSRGVNNSAAWLLIRTKEYKTGCRAGQATDPESWFNDSLFDDDPAAWPGWQATENVAKPARKPASGAHADFIRRFTDRWRAEYHEDYSFRDARDGASVKWILTQCKQDIDAADRMLARFFEDKSQFVAQENRHSLGIFVSRFNNYKVDSSHGRPQTAQQRGEFEHHVELPEIGG